MWSMFWSLTNDVSFAWPISQCSPPTQFRFICCQQSYLANMNSLNLRRVYQCRGYTKVPHKELCISIASCCAVLLVSFFAASLRELYTFWSPWQGFLRFLRPAQLSYAWATAILFPLAATLLILVRRRTAVPKWGPEGDVLSPLRDWTQQLLR